MRPLLWMVVLLPSAAAWTPPLLSAQERRQLPTYDFRESAAFRELDAQARERLLTVAVDFDVLAKALDAFMDDHHGAPPLALAELVPKYLEKLPVDPFAQNVGPLPKHLAHFERSLDGQGYLYCQKPDGQTIKSYKPLEFEPAPGAWYITSAGLQKFPFRYPRSNPGLIRTRGYWGRFMLDVF